VSGAPWSFDEARDAAREASQHQQHSEEFVRTTARDAAMAEEAYRVALAEKIVTLRAEKVPASVCADVARGDRYVAELRRRRDIAEGVREAASQAAWRRNADRRDVQRFAEWSFRRELAEVGVSG
jgi:hypothetical protein